MKIGVPKEIKIKENRVGLVPGGVRQLVQEGNEVFIETNAGTGIGIDDEAYINVGAKILPDASSNSISSFCSPLLLSLGSSGILFGSVLND